LTWKLPTVIILYRFLSNNSFDERHLMNREKWLTIDELTEYLKMGRTKLYRMAQNGEIPASKIGNQWRFDREEIDLWMKSQRPVVGKMSAERGKRAEHEYD